MKNKIITLALSFIIIIGYGIYANINSSNVNGKIKLQSTITSIR